MSIVDEIYNIADKVAGETVTRQGNTIVAAIDALNDALSGSDQPAARSVTEALSLLAQTIKSNNTTYALVSNTEVSINGNEPSKYTAATPAPCAPGDVLTWSNAGYDRCVYYSTTDMDETIKSVSVTSPYTIEAVVGAAALMLSRSMG